MPTLRSAWSFFLEAQAHTCVFVTFEIRHCRGTKRYKSQESRIRLKTLHPITFSIDINFASCHFHERQQTIHRLTTMLSPFTFHAPIFCKLINLFIGSESMGRKLNCYLTDSRLFSCRRTNQMLGTRSLLRQLGNVCEPLLLGAKHVLPSFRAQYPERT